MHKNVSCADFVDVGEGFVVFLKNQNFSKENDFYIFSFNKTYV